MKNWNTMFSTVLILLGCFGLLPKAQALVPAPDGGYPGGNTAEGQSALLSVTTGGHDTADGFLSLRSNTTGSYNTALGAGALLSNTIGFDNTATGFGALLSNTTGVTNTANGEIALFRNTTGAANTAIGAGALFGNTTGIENTAAGHEALFNNTTGSGNTALGNGAGSNVTAADNVICIGIAGVNVSNSCFIGNIYGVNEGGTISAVYINSNGQLGTQPPPSSVQFKKDIRPMDKASEAILGLKPVTFHYKSGNANTPQFGLIAEEVAKVNAALVLPDKEGKPYTVRYDQVNAMLLNEFLKEHSTVQELKKEVAALAATVKEQASQIQKVSAQLAAASPSGGGLEASKFATGRICRGGPASDVTLNNP